jgi:hypothetical protein
MIYFKDDSILLVRTQYHPVQSQVQSGGGGSSVAALRSLLLLLCMAELTLINR